MTTALRMACVNAFALGLLVVVAGAQAGCDMGRDSKGGKPLSRERGGDVPTGPVNPGAEPPVIVAARAGNAAEVRRLAGQGADVNAFGNNRQTALIAAAEAGHREVVEALVEAGADANLRDGKGNTAAEAAADKGHARIAESLRKAEVKPPKGPAKPVAAPKSGANAPRQ